MTTGMESLLHAALFPTRAGARCQEYSGHSNKLMVSLGCIRGVRSLLQIWTCVTTVLSMWEVRVLLFLGLGTKQSSSVRSSGMECCYVSCPSPLCISRAQRHHTPHTERLCVLLGLWLGEQELPPHGSHPFDIPGTPSADLCGFALLALIPEFGPVFSPEPSDPPTSSWETSRGQ